MDCSTPSLPVHHQLPEVNKIQVHWVSDAIQPSTIQPSSVIPLSSCIQSFTASGFFHWSVLHIRWPKYWSFSFSMNPSNGYSGLISFRMDWLALFTVQGTLKSLLQHHSSKAQLSLYSAIEALPEFQRLSLLPESYGKMEVLYPSGNGCICRRNRTKRKGNFVSPYADLA